MLSEFGTQIEHPGILLDIQGGDNGFERLQATRGRGAFEKIFWLCVDDVFEIRAMYETFELSTEQKRSTDDGIQIKLELSVPKETGLSNMNHQKQKGGVCFTCLNALSALPPKIGLAVSPRIIGRVILFLFTSPGTRRGRVS
jgi:hypothetical protein